MRQLTDLGKSQPNAFISKLPMRQLTQIRKAFLSVGVSKLPMRQLTDKSDNSFTLEIF